MNLPPLDLLDPTSSTPVENADHGAAILRALPDVEITGRQVGSAVTRYLVTPPAGTDPAKIERAIGAVALAVGSPCRYAGPEGTAVAIEVPNTVRRTVTLRDVLTGPALVGLGLAVGQDVAGNVVTASLAKLPHLLVGGATGQGKSVTINGMLASLLMRCTPDDLRLVMIDPKRVEFAAYARLPHLLRPIVTDPAEAPEALRDVEHLMDQRYTDMAAAGVKDIAGWNDSDAESWPRLVVVIDELADLMMVNRKAVEARIVRIAQLGRAAGVHLLVATQFPKADVITSMIGQNIPSRMALTTKDHVASRLIIGASGAQNLTGAGDSLWAPVGSLAPLRVQAPFVSDDELARIIAWWIRTREVQTAVYRARERQLAQDARVAELNKLSAAEKVTRELARQTEEAREILTTPATAPQGHDAGAHGVAAVVALAAEYRERLARGERIHEHVGLRPLAHETPAPDLVARVAELESALSGLTGLFERTLEQVLSTSSQEV